MATADTDQRYWALYLQITREYETAGGKILTERRQRVILPPVSDKCYFRYMTRNQSDLHDRVRWSDAMTDRPEAADIARLTDGFFTRVENYPGWTALPPITVPVTEAELLNLKPAGDKPTLYRVMDRVKRVARKKYGVAI